MELDLPFMARTFLLSLQGLPVTLGLTILTLVLALPAGFLLALIRILHLRPFHALAAFWVSLVRGTPVVIHLMMAWSLLPSLLAALAKGGPWEQVVFAIDPFWYALLVFSAYQTAILSEVIRSALLTVDRGQYEAALSAGLSPSQAWRRIVIPQAALVALPNLSNAAVNLLKSTSLAFLLTVKDITAIAKIEAAYGYRYIEAWLVIFLLYLLVCGAVQFLFHLLEKRMGAWRDQGTPEKPLRNQPAST